MMLIDADNDSFKRMCANVPCDHCPAFDNCNSGNNVECFEMIVKAIGEVDAEPVVRCKDCKHFDNTNDIGWCKIHSRFSDGDWNSFSDSDYCSRGERKDEEKYNVCTTDN